MLMVAGATQAAGIAPLRPTPFKRLRKHEGSKKASPWHPGAHNATVFKAVL
jgi:hypothetical protein